MNTGDPAYNYATALYEAVFERLIQSLDAVAQGLAGKPALRERLRAADAGFESQKAGLDSILTEGVDPMVRNLLYTLLQRGDLSLLDDVVTSLRAQMQRAESEPTPVNVVTATTLPDDQRKALETRLAAQHGANLAYEYEVDPAILGGMIVRIGDKLIDGSVASKLAALRQSLGVTTER